MTKKNDTARVTLTLEIDFVLKGERPEDMAALVQGGLRRAIGMGLLTGETPAEVDEWTVESVVSEVRDVVALRRGIEQYLAEQIDGGQIDLGRISDRMVAFGMMTPAQFVEEMCERMGQADEEPAVSTGMKVR